MIKNGRFWTQKFDLALNLNIFDEIRGPRSISEVGRSHFWTFWVHFGRFRRFWVRGCPGGSNGSHVPGVIF